jgi:hypothetical protein
MARRDAESTWVFRPAGPCPADVMSMSGSHVQGTGPVCDDGRVEIVLGDGTRIRATPSEIIAE